MLLGKLLFRNERYRRIVIGKVIRHPGDSTADGFLIRTFFCYDVAVAAVFLARRQLRSFTGADTFNHFLHRHCILNASLNTGYPADGIRVALADSGSPESILFPLRQHSLHQQPVHGEQARIPAC
ncbi:hypothetical protein D3C81_1565820 [compost metagenome]